MIRRCHFESIYQSEAVASGTALGRRATRHAAPSDVSLPRRLSNNGDVSARYVVEAARTGDAAARQLVEAEAKWLRIPLASLFARPDRDGRRPFQRLRPPGADDPGDRRGARHANLSRRADRAGRSRRLARQIVTSLSAPDRLGRGCHRIALTFFRLPRQHHLPLMQPGSLVTQQNLSRLEIDDRPTKAVASKASFGRRPDGCRLARLTRTAQA